MANAIFFHVLMKVDDQTWWWLERQGDLQALAERLSPESSFVAREVPLRQIQRKRRSTGQVWVRIYGTWITQKAYLVDSKCLIVVNNSNLNSIGKFRIVAFLDVDNVIDWQTDLDTVAVVAWSEDDLLYLLDPFCCTGSSLCFEVVGFGICSDREGCAFFILALCCCKVCRNSITQIYDISRRERSRRVLVIWQDIPFEHEPVLLVARVTLTSFGQVAGLDGHASLLLEIGVEADMALGDIYIAL